MTKNCIPENWEASGSKKDGNVEEQEEDQDEDEALSFSDLPISLIHDARPPSPHDPLQDTDFEFGLSTHGGPSLSAPETDMCAADDVFFGGRILPLRRLSSAASPRPLRCSSASDSTDVGSVSSGGFSSSRSSSARSRSNSSGANRDARAPNPFHAHPSPKPQIRVKPAGGRGGRSAAAAAWDIFRPGLVRTPTIELRDLKHRASNGSRSSGNSSMGSRSNSSTNSSSAADGGAGESVGRGRRGFDYGFLNGCTCSISKVEIPSKKTHGRAYMRRSGSKKAPPSAGGGKEKVQAPPRPPAKKKQGRKESTSCRRTSEWVKEVSHASRGIGLDGGAKN